MSDEIYWLVHCEFRDHTRNSHGGKCKCWGLLIDEDEHYHYIYGWATDGSIEDHVAEWFQILKVSVHALRKFGQDRLGWLEDGEQMQALHNSDK